ncbi:MAG: hypothetical protein ABI369_04530 [Acetobacteraceae bacterium]
MTSEHRDREKSDKVDRASEDSFPASDPPSYSGITGDGHPRKKPADETPTGSPTSDRHATETAHQHEDQEQPHTPRRGRT